ncbi:UbiD family decarboxylase [Amycolatopsis alkalitolerans]|uniref:UbiD family decarboxylase n=1 Tax=Amycolatopsis alkalitolerans TaxID=2547244 RepID=A0A5C4LYW2_9PSEU|nr:UbiD family decarboxylase [Amycolatopsis alkalitolerans]TNC24195.1 UbiD family decarboxylase [Amycolatopsis alkalitolerans]
MTKDLRTFLTDLVKQDPGGLKQVSAPVDPRFGITAYGAWYDERAEYPALLFTDVSGVDIPCLTNLVATHERMALALGVPVETLTRTSLAGQHRAAHPPVRVTEAPVQEVIWTGDDADLRRLPIPTHNELDGGPFLTAAVALMRDPDSGALNAGIYRHHVYDGKRMGVWFFGSHDGGTIYRRYAERGEPTPVAIVIGHHPAFLMGAVSRVPGIGGEYDAAGAFLGEPVELVPALTSDLLVPARAEIVLEGRILAEERAEEGPFAEWPGHYVGGGLKPVIEIDTITMRRDAIFQDIQASGREHRLMGALPRIASIHEAVRQKVPGLKAVNIPLHTRMHCYLSIRKQFDSDPTRAAFAAFNTEPENLRAVIVVDDDIDVYDEREVSWAIGTRFDAARDLQIIPQWNGPGGLLPTNWRYDAEGGRTPRMSSAVIVDATKPAPPVVFPPRARVPGEAVRAVDTAAVHDVTSVAGLWD